MSDAGRENRFRIARGCILALAAGLRIAPPGGATVSYKQEGWSFGSPPLYGAVFAVTILLLAGGTVVRLRRTTLRFVPLRAFGGMAIMEAFR